MHLIGFQALPGPPGASRGLQGPPGASKGAPEAVGCARLVACLQGGVEGVFKWDLNALRLDASTNFI